MTIMTYVTHGPFVMNEKGAINGENHDFLLSEEGTSKIALFLYELGTLLRILRDVNEALMLEYVHYVRQELPELSKHALNALEAHEVRGKKLVNTDGSLHVYIRDGVNIIAHILLAEDGHEELTILPPFGHTLSQYADLVRASIKGHAIH